MFLSKSFYHCADILVMAKQSKNPIIDNDFLNTFEEAIARIL